MLTPTPHRMPPAALNSTNVRYRMRLAPASPGMTARRNAVNRPKKTAQPPRPRIEAWAAAQASMRGRGGWAVFFGRFTAFLRAVMPGLAGASRMRYRTFVLFNAAGGILWGVGVSILGYLAGTSFSRVEHSLGVASAAITVVFVM